MPEPAEVDDLARILAYADAIDPASPMAAEGATGEPADPRVIGPDIVAFPFWTPSFCRAVIRAAELVGAFSPQPDDPVPGYEVSLAAISSNLYRSLEEDLGVRAWPILRRVWPLIEYHGLRDAFVIRYALGEQESLRIHHDVAQVSASIRLNDDYRGAELAFPRQGVDNSSTAVGELLAWPSLVTHPHETRPLHSGVKYALTIWFEPPAYTA